MAIIEKITQGDTNWEPKINGSIEEVNKSLRLENDVFDAKDNKVTNVGSGAIEEDSADGINGGDVFENSKSNYSNKVYATTPLANSFIKELYILNPDNLNLNIRSVSNDYNGDYRVNFSTTEDTSVAVAQTLITERDNGVIAISALNSNVTGYIIVDWDGVKTGYTTVNTPVRDLVYDIKMSPYINYFLGTSDFVESERVNNIEIGTCRHVYSSDLELNKFIKEIYLTNPNDIDLHLYYVRNDVGGIFSVNIVYEGAGGNVAVAQYYKSESRNDGILEIYSLDSTYGLIEGYIIVDWDSVEYGVLSALKILLNSNTYILEASSTLYSYVKSLKSYPVIACWVDDDISDNITSVKTISDTLEIKATFAAITSLLDTAKLTTLNSYQDEGFSIVNHSEFHTNAIWTPTANTIVEKQALEAEMISSKKTIRDAGFFDADFLVYPFGTYTTDFFVNVSKVLAKKHFRAAIGTGGTANSITDTDGYCINRIKIDSQVAEATLKATILEAYENGDTIVFYTHSGIPAEYDATYTQNILTYAKGLGYDFMTIPEMYKYKKHIYEK